MSLEKFFNPQSVAIVGASQSKGKVGHEVLSSMIRAGYEGKIFPVNPGAKTIEGLKCYSSVEAIGQVPDLVVVVVPAGIVPTVMQQCANAGVKSVIIITSGFKEVGEEGRKLEEQIIRISRRAGIRVISIIHNHLPVRVGDMDGGGRLPICRHIVAERQALQILGLVDT